MIATPFMARTLSGTNKPTMLIGERGESMATGRPKEPEEVVSERTKLFIRRERIRRELMRVKPHETICLQGETVETLLKWIHDLETENKTIKERVLKNGIKER
jgi:hypothetical protein